MRLVNLRTAVVWQAVLLLGVGPFGGLAFDSIADKPE